MILALNLLHPFCNPPVLFWNFHQCHFMNQIKKTDLITLLSHLIYKMQKQYALVIEIINKLRFLSHILPSAWFSLL